MTYRASRLFLLAAACLAFLAAVLSVVDLAPRVEPDFFFASDDPQLAASAAIEALFPGSPQILVRAAGDVEDPAYLESLAGLTEALRRVPGVVDVKSLTRGPSTPAAAARSPLWQRLLLPAPGASTLILEIDGEARSAELVGAVEAVLAEYGDRLDLDASGVPLVVELIRRHLLRDLRVFSLISLLIFGLAAAWIHRSLPIAAGTLLSSLTACGLTLLALHAMRLKIGLLTANIVTIVFVLALSHTIFLAANWRRAGGEGASRSREAVRVTLPASFWCMTTTALGFSSLLFADARPLRELGTAGGIGTLAAFAVAYSLFPAFLRLADSAPRSGRKVAAPAPEPGSWRHGTTWGTVILTALTVAAAPGLLRLTTDPSLLSYFDRGDEIYAGLEAVDRDGGSSPLLMVLESPDGGPLHQGTTLEKLQMAQDSAEADPAVGSALSLPILLAEARRQPLAVLLSNDQLLALLDTAAFGKIAGSFVTADRRQALLFLRMRESERAESRRAVIERLEAAVGEAGLVVTHVGGLYDLQGRLGRLVASSLLSGFGALALLFLAIALWVARSARSAAAMVGGLIVLPVLIFGTFGYLGLPLDVIASPAANVAIGLGIDSMIHLVLRRRKLSAEGLGNAEAWSVARRQMTAPILTAALVVGAGFGVFALSSFPPTRHFGIAIVLGTTAAAAWALTAFPFLGARRS
ncbi:MAG: MMPL family transporter [Acidobacteria bacterium]|nr:MMPL family transporter [Acidobacteriota bacterium]